MIKYATQIEREIKTIPTLQPVNGRLEVTSEEKKEINVLHIILLEKITGRPQIKELAQESYLEIMETLGDDDLMGVKVHIGEDILRFSVYENDDISEIERCFIREYHREIEFPQIFNKRHDNPQTPEGM